MRESAIYSILLIAGYLIRYVQTLYKLQEMQQAEYDRGWNDAMNADKGFYG